MAKPPQVAKVRHRPGIALLRFENVGLRYDMGPEVVSDLNFAVAPQSFQFLTGPSGAGKTTVLRLMLLSLRPTRGVVQIFGQDAAALSKDEVTALRRRIGIVFQDFRLLDHLTTYENVALPLRAMGRAEGDYRPEVIELLKWVGLGDRMNASPRVLSGGEKQRAAIARAYRPSRASARRRADRKRRSWPCQTAALAVRRVAPARDGGRHRDTRLATHGSVRFRAAARCWRRQARDLRRRFRMIDSIDDTRFGTAPQPLLKRDTPLIPGDSIAGRALVVVDRDHDFPACLAAGGALLVAQASEGWRSASSATLPSK